MMAATHERFPRYGFDVHKGYCTPEHNASLDRYGPCVEHRWTYANVVTAALRHRMTSPRRVVSKPGLFDGLSGPVVNNEDARPANSPGREPDIPGPIELDGWVDGGATDRGVDLRPGGEPTR
jgi:hypothetical protein